MWFSIAWFLIESFNGLKYFFNCFLFSRFHSMFHESFHEIERYKEIWIFVYWIYSVASMILEVDRKEDERGNIGKPNNLCRNQTEHLNIFSKFLQYFPQVQSDQQIRRVQHVRGTFSLFMFKFFHFLLLFFANSTTFLILF